MEPLDDMMCLAPDDVAYASYRAVEGVVTPNGALHGTILVRHYIMLYLVTTCHVLSGVHLQHRVS